MPRDMKQDASEEWEDMDDGSREEGSRASSPVMTPRKHRARKPAPKLLPQLKETRSGQRPLAKDRPHVKGPSKSPRRWIGAVLSAFFFFIGYVSEILLIALAWLRKPLSLILVGYSLAIMISHLQHAFTETLRSALDPICVLPGISRLAICNLRNSNGDFSIASRHPHDVPKRADFPALVGIQTTAFEHLLDESVGGSGLALEIKKAEMATSDLTTLVRVSSLASKDTIADTLGVFVEGARHTARGLQRFSAKVGGAVDGIVAVNNYALSQIEAGASATSNRHWLSSWIPLSPRSTSLTAVTKSFTQSMSVLESELHMLILAAEASLHDLDVLEEQLRLLHAIVSREDLSLNTSKQELLSNLWTFLGGNRAELRRFETHLRLLSGLAEYRRHALAHVVGALHTLQTMSAELEMLRERVSQPVMLSDSIPLEVHVKSIRGGLVRLIEGRSRVKQIEDARYAKLLGPLEK